MNRLKLFSAAAALLLAAGTASAETFEYKSVSPADGSSVDVAAGYAFEQVAFLLPKAGSVNEEIAANVTMVGADEKSYPCTVEYKKLGNMYYGYVKFDITTSGIYSLTMPEGVFTVTSTGAVSPAGTYTYNVTVADPLPEVAFTSIVPANDATIPGFAPGETIKMTLENGEAVNSISIIVTDQDTEEVMIYSYVDRYVQTESGPQETGAVEGDVWTWTSAGNYELYLDHTYTAKFTASTDGEQLAETELTWHGATVFVNTVSDITIVSVDPTPGTYLKGNQNTISITFSGWVEFVEGFATTGGQGATKAAVTVTPNGDNTVWEVVVSETFMATVTDANIRLLFRDQEGLYVRGGNDIPDVADAYFGDLAGFSIHYPMLNGVECTLDPASGSTVESLSSIRVSYEDKFIRWCDNAALVVPSDIKVCNADNQIVAYVVQAQDENGLSGDSYYVDLILNTTITADGTYTMDIPWGAFSIGEEYDAVTYGGQTASYKIGDQVALTILEAGADTPATYYTLQGIRVDNPVKGGVYIRQQGNSAQKVRL